MTERVFYNALALITQGSYAKLQKLIQQHTTWEAAYESISKSARIDPDKAWKKLEAAHIALCLRDDPEFPALLREIPFPPFGLYTLGAPINRAPKVAIVGTRKATAIGLETAKKFAKALGESGLEIVSGMALGTDAAAHLGALDAGAPTIAVLANGLDRIYPHQNDRLHAAILSGGGTVASEYPLGEISYQTRFLERNRIVSGLSKAIIIIEAPIPSGTLSTARYGVEQNREVLVIPGSIGNPNYAGSHQLIKSGATLITEPEDVLVALGMETKRAKKRTTKKLDAYQQEILEVLASGDEPMHTDEIIAKTHLPESVVQTALALLVINNYIKEAGGRYFIA